MTPIDLHSWVRTRWVELLDTARAATPGDPHWRAAHWSEGSVVNVDRYGSGLLCVWFPSDVELPLPAATPYLTAPNAAHVAAFDPTLTIAICTAALERLDRHWAHVAFCWSRGGSSRVTGDYPDPPSRDGGN